MKDINRCPSLLLDGFSSYSPKACRTLFDGKKVSHILGIKIDELCSNPDIGGAMGRISVSGVQEKFSAVIRDGEICVSSGGEQSTHILKPAPWDRTLQNRKQIPFNEHLTMQIAHQVYGIETAANGLCFDLNDQPVYITKRFDILPEGGKAILEDFASLVGKVDSGHANFKYSGSYSDIASVIRQTVPVWMIDMERLFAIIVFNYIYGNGDAHFKNFSLINRGGGWRLAPAYDLMNTALHIAGDDFALDQGLSPTLEKTDVYYYSGHPCRLDFERFGVMIGLKPPRIKRILDKFVAIPIAVNALIELSFLSPKMKRSYLRIITERTLRFNRKSE